MKSEEKEPIFDMNLIVSLLNNLNIVGVSISELNESDIQNNRSLLELLSTFADDLVDLNTNYRISIGGSTVNIGKEVMKLFSDQYYQIKGGE